MAHTTEIMVNGILTQVTEFDHSAQEIDDTVDALGGAKTPQEALANLGAGVRPNLGDNCDFTAPVNQRGVTSWSIPSGDVPIFDRWKIQATEGSVEANLESGGLKLSMAAINQGIKQTYQGGYLLPQKVYTSSVIVDGQLYSAEIVPEEVVGTVVQYPGTEFSCAITFNGGACQWYPYIDYRSGSRTVTIARCKLENDWGQTLGYMDADGTWKLLPQPESDYATQLRRCKRYYESSTSSWTIPANLTMMVPFEVEKRIVPTVTIENVSGGSATFDYVGTGCFRVINPTQQPHDFRWQASAEL